MIAVLSPGWAGMGAGDRSHGGISVEARATGSLPHHLTALRVPWVSQLFSLAMVSCSAVTSNRLHASEPSLTLPQALSEATLIFPALKVGT